MTLLGSVTRCANCATTTFRLSPHPILNTVRFAANWIWTIPSAITEQMIAGLMNGTAVRNRAIATAPDKPADREARYIRAEAGFAAVDGFDGTN